MRKARVQNSIHLHKFAEMVAFEEIGIGGTLPRTERYREFFKKIHPAQILKSRVSVPIYEIKYSYVTARGNYRERKKYILLRIEHEDIGFEIEMALEDWADNAKKHRKVSNVEILEIKPIAYAVFSLNC